MHILGTKIPVIFRTHDVDISDIHKRKRSLVFDTNHASNNMFVKRKQKKQFFRRKKRFDMDKKLSHCLHTMYNPEV